MARHRVGGGRGPGESTYADLPVLAMGQATTRYHISLDVADRPGVLAQVATAFADHDVSIETVRQQLVARRTAGGRRASLVVVTHTAHRRGPVGHGRRPRARSTSSAASPPSCASKAREWPTSGAA